MVQIKYIFLVFFMQLCTINAVTQSWLPFPTDQKSLYQYENFSEEGLIDTYEVDTTLAIADHVRFRIHGTHQVSGCFSDSLDILFGPIGAQNFGFRPEYYDLRGDTVKWKNVTFRTQLDTGESFDMTTDISGGYAGFRFTCTARIKDSILGVFDSIRIFSIVPIDELNIPITGTAYSDVEIKLSKLFGLIQFPVWTSLNDEAVNPKIMELIGFHNAGGIAAGFPIPHQDHGFFPLFNLGDLFCWRRLETWDGVRPTERIHYCDSIIQVLGNGFYNLQRTRSSGIIEYFDSVTVWPIGDNYKKMVKAPTGRFTDANSYTGLAFNAYYSTNTAPEFITSAHFSTSARRIFHDCTVDPLIDQLSTISWTFDTFAGLNYLLFNTRVYRIGYAYSHKTSYTRRGARINGIQQGIIDLEQLTGLHPIENRNVNLFPNPASTTLYIHSDTPQWNYHYTIIDMMGQQIQNGISTENKININSLITGPYIIQIQNEDNQYSMPFIKM